MNVSKVGASPNFNGVMKFWHLKSIGDNQKINTDDSEISYIGQNSYSGYNSVRFKNKDDKDADSVLCYTTSSISDILASYNACKENKNLVINLGEA